MEFSGVTAKYKKGASQKQGSRSSKGKNSKLSTENQNIPCSCKSQENYVAAPNSYAGPTSPWSWSCYYSPLDYANLHMRSYMIQYPPTYVNHISMQRSIVLDNNLVGSAYINSKGGHKDSDDSKYSQPRWCPSSLNHTQKRRLQWMRKQGSMEQRVAVIPARSATTKLVWRPKQVVP
jgi:hypothetical protein